MASIAMTGGTRRAWGATPEIYFPKHIDNSRLVKVNDKGRSREMVMFAASLVLLFVVFMAYGWQHYRAIEYGYKNEALRSSRDALLEANRQLRLEEASLREPARIDELAHQMGLQTPMAGQVIRLEPGEPGETNAPVMARMAAVSVISAR
ncbi:MAG TPA: cell division protein FtsL [Terriglobales bacterium]|nr:cell division protein FtsL [Terriglobales bacterium]